MLLYQRHEKRPEQKSRQNILIFALQKKIRKRNLSTTIKSVLDYRFNSSKHNHVFLFVTQGFLFFECGFSWSAVSVCLKSLNGSPACDS